MISHLVLFATREGHTKLIAEHIGEVLWRSGTPAVVLDAAHLPADFSLGDYQSAIIAASVHQHRHEGEIISFVKRYRADLEDMNTAFLSVSLSEAVRRTPKPHPKSGPKPRQMRSG
jgi:menaquinone-dependent protoporphyrinogen oxidase